MAAEEGLPEPARDEVVVRLVQDGADVKEPLFQRLAHAALFGPLRFKLTDSLH